MEPKYIENPPSCLDAVISRFNSDTFIDNVCLSYRHDFGLMAEQDKQRMRFECKEWMRAIQNNWKYHKCPYDEHPLWSAEYCPNCGKFWHDGNEHFC